MKPLWEMSDAELHVEQASLLRRLRAGDEKLQEARQRGDAPFLARWEDLWIQLLHRYEQVYDHIQTREAQRDADTIPVAQPALL